MQLFSLTKENTCLVEKLREAKGLSSMAMTNSGDLEQKGTSFNYRDPSDGIITEEAMSPASITVAQAGIPSGTLW